MTRVAALSIAFVFHVSVPCAGADDVETYGSETTPGVDLGSGSDGEDLAWWPWLVTAPVAGLALSLDTLLDTPEPRWSSVGSVDWAVTDGLILGQSGRPAAGLISDILLISSIAAPFLDAVLWRQDERSSSRTAYRLVTMDAMMMSFSLALTSIAKVSAGRQRPFGRFCETDDEFGSCESSSRNRSFFSGHAAASFTGASLVCAHQRLRGQSALGRSECIGGLAVATTTAFLRLASARHYLSDVAVGAAVGLLLGYIIPIYVFPRRLPVIQEPLAIGARYW